MLGEKIKGFREKKKFTLRELAEISQLNYSYICALEIGIKTNPSLDVLNKLAKALEIEIQDLIKTN